MSDASPSPPIVPRTPADRDTSGWLASFAVHALAAVALALYTAPLPPIAATFLLEGETPPAERLDDGLFVGEVALEIPEVEAISDSAVSSAAPPAATPTLRPAAPAPAATDFSSSLASSLATAPLDESLAAVSGTGVDGRTEAGKAALVAAKGGSPGSERAVVLGLGWLARHQLPDGSWSLIHTRGACDGACGNPARIPGEDPFGESRASATGLALLPFLGAGETPDRGRHRRVVRRGLQALVAMGRPDEENPGLSWADSGRLYAHGICTIALCEAYGLTGDPDLRRPAQAALEYLAYAQDPAGGGWRYTPQQAGDTSVTGWQVMALKSGQLAELSIPPRVAGRAAAFLDSASGEGGTRYGYLAAEPADGTERAAEPYATTPTLSAVGLLSRMYLGWTQGDARLDAGVERLASEGPSADNFYHNYYAAQAIFHQTGGVGPVWRQWNDAVREQLIRQQLTRGHEKGSWWVAGPHNNRGGRLYATALATMTLEVYYRYLPLYQSEAVSTELPD